MRSYSDWTRRWHVFVALYFLCSLWLFGVSGLVLNHPGWEFAQFWPQRKEMKYERAFRLQAHEANDAGAVAARLGIRGEVELGSGPQTPGRLRFRVIRPGRLWDVDADPERGMAQVKETAVGFWGVMSGLHHFNGVRAGDSVNRPDWLLTGIWVLSMDALAVGMLFIALSGVYFWWASGSRRIAGLVTLAAGTATCAAVLWGL